ncbi:MAG TPA: ABC transporter permease [Vicinamibacterales bacterium]|nr:ABC transporter permease [Vicinamibacterales bacterium]
MRDLHFWRWRKAEDDDVDRELQVHLELATEERLEAGIPLRDAQLAARREFGSVALTKEELRDMRTGAALERLWQETCYAARRLLRSPAFTAATVLTLALAIGANASIFAVVYRVVLHPLPYGNSERLLALEFSVPSRNVPKVYYIPSRLYVQYLERARTLDGLALYVAANELTLTGQGSPERIRVSRTTSSLPSVLRVTPALGRWFDESEAAPGASATAVLSHGFWVRRFGQDPNVVGRPITLDGIPTLVLGVMPASFTFPDPRVDVWIPAPYATKTTATDSYTFAAIARLRDGATIADARSELTRLSVDLDSSYPNNGYRALVSTATTLLDATVGSIEATLWVLLTAVGLVLLVACANVANLFLVRSEVRQREIAMRRALGAGNRAIANYFLTESIMLSLAGGALGLALAWGAVRMLVAFGPAVGPWWASLPRLQEVRVDGAVWLFTFGLSLLTALVFGSIPLIRFTRPAESLHDRGWSTASPSRHRTRQLLMAGQVAFALVLLIASGLMQRSFQTLRAVDPGFDATSTLTFRIGLPRVAYPDEGRMSAAHRAISDRLSTLPGVAAVAASTCLPLSEQQLCQGGPLFVEGHALPPGAVAPFVASRAIDGGYFETMRMRVLAGRGIERGDVEREEPVVVVNQALVNLAFGGSDPIGRQVRFGNPALSPRQPEWLTVVGVVGNTPIFGLAEAAPFPQLYMPIFRSRRVNMAPRLDAMTFVVRTRVTPESLAEAVRRAVGDIDANLALAQVHTLQDVLDRAAAQMAFTMVLLAIAAGVSLMLGVIGIYGAMSYIVSQRTAEIGIRLALGAQPGNVSRMIVRQGSVVAVAGVVIGLAAAFAGGRVIHSLLYGVSPRDPRVFAGTTALLLGVVVLACWLPARRAARLNPLDALRTE